MAIVVRHETGAGPVAGAAFGGSQGAARQRGALGMAAAMSRSQDAAAARAGQLQRDSLGQERTLERMKLNADLQQQSAESAQTRRRDDLEFSLTAKQRSDHEQLANAEAAALASSDFTPGEKSELRRKFAARRARIQPVERPRQQTPRERFDARTYRDPQTGRIYPIDENGGFGRPIYDPPERQPTFKDRAAAVEKAMNYASDVEGNVNEAKFKAVMGLMGFSDESGAGLGGLGGGVQGVSFLQQPQSGPDGSMSMQTAKQLPVSEGGGMPQLQGGAAFDLNAPGDAGQLYKNLPPGSPLPANPTPEQIDNAISFLTAKPQTADRLGTEEVTSIPVAQEQAKAEADNLNRLTLRLSELAAAKPNVQYDPYGGTLGNEGHLYDTRVKQAEEAVQASKERIKSLKSKEDELNARLQRASAKRDILRGIAQRKAAEAAKKQAAPAVKSKPAASAPKSKRRSVPPEKAALAAARRKAKSEQATLKSLESADTSTNKGAEAYAQALKARYDSLKAINGEDRTPAEHAEYVSIRRKLRALGRKTKKTRKPTGRSSVSRAGGGGKEFTSAELEAGLKRFKNSGGESR